MGRIKEFLKKIRDFMYRNPITEYLIPVKDQVILESLPAFSDNTYAIYQEMLKNNYQKKYKIIWFVMDKNIPDKFKRDDISYYDDSKRDLFHIIKRQYLINTSKFIITCNDFYHRKTKRQVIIYLNHGMPIKDCTKLKIKRGCVDMSLATSKIFLDNLSSSLDIDKNKFAFFQLPRDDQLFQKKKNIKKIMGLEKQKIIAWLPTFRQYQDGKRVDSSFDMPLGIPIIYNEKDLIKFNEYLKKKNITLFIKPHFAAKVDTIQAKTLSNFKIITNKDLEAKDITLYEFLSGTDALLTDYSSVYYDYLITNKPIGLTLDDYEEYKKETGFAVDYKEVIRGHYIYNLNDLYDFVEDLDKGKDTYEKERQKAIKTLNYDTEGNFSKKIFDYLKDKYDF